MTVLDDLRHDALATVAVVEAPEDLARVRETGTAAAVWWRKPLPSFQRWIDALDPAQLPQGRVILPPAAVAETVRALCDSAGTPDGPERARLVDDIAALADVFAGLMRARLLRLRLDPVATDACRRFHVDAVTARLVCTYRGAGTQYGLAAAGADPGHVFSLPTGAAMVMRGTLWPERPASGLVHRSPPIAGSGATRLLLALDPVFDPEDAA